MIKIPYIKHNYAYHKLKSMAKHLDKQPSIKVVHQGVIINDTILIAGVKGVFKFVSGKKWTKFTPVALAKAINSNSVEEYFASQLGKFGDSQAINRERLEAKIARREANPMWVG